MRSGWLETATILEGGQRNNGIPEDAGVSATRYAPFSQVRILARYGGSGTGAHNGRGRIVVGRDWLLLLQIYTR